MDNVFLNSLNKKIGIVIILVLTIGYTVNFFYGGFTYTNTKGGYMHKAEANPKSALLNENPLQQVNQEIQFLPIHELEKFLKETEYERLYVQMDSNFDQKVENLENYLGRRKSPLAEKARFIVIMANKFEIDYRLLPAISIIESSGGRKLYRKYNAWGWGGSKGITFESWEHSLYVVSKGIKTGYYDRGATTPELMAPAYNPHTPNEWAGKVRGIMNQIGSEL
jgi:hypothetical protein